MSKSLCIRYFLLMAMLACAGVTHAADGFQEFREKTLKPQKAKFDSLAERLKDEPDFKAYLIRLDLVKQVTEEIIHGFGVARETILEDVLSDVAHLPTTHSPSTRPDSDRTPVSAEEILTFHQQSFASQLPVPGSGVSEEDRQCLLDYYDANVQVAARFIAQRGATFAAMTKTRSAEILQLCLVMPFLHVPDKAWSRSHIEILASWMKTLASLATLEAFSLTVRRPWTAYQLARYGTSPSTTLDVSVPFVEYLRSASKSLAVKRDYQTAMHCLRCAIEVADNIPSPSLGDEIRLDLAQMYSDTGHPQLAGDEVKHVRDSSSEPTQRGRSAVLRLKYLYEAGMYDAIINEAPVALERPDFAPYEPQILYIAWVAHRHENHPEDADRLKKRFLDRFPDHPLVADLYFADAMTALAASNYDEARRLLEIVEVRFSQSRLVKRAKELGDRLDQLQQKKAQ